METTSLFWFFVPATIIHISEETLLGFVSWFPKFTKFSITYTEFNSVNGLYVALTIIGALINYHNLFISMTIINLAAVNVCFHTIGALRTRQYSPGIVTAYIIFLPLVVYFYSNLFSNQQLQMAIFIGSVVSSIALWFLMTYSLHLLYINAKKDNLDTKKNF